MNKVILIGRLVADPEVRWSNSEKPMCVARYKLAVDRNVKAKNNEQSADFPSCIAFGKNGEFAKKWLSKGMKIAIIGHLQTGSYTNKDNVKVYTTEVVVDAHEFVDSRKAGNDETPAGGFGMPQNGFGSFSGDFSASSVYSNVGEDFAMLDGEDGQLPF